MNVTLVGTVLLGLIHRYGSPEATRIFSGGHIRQDPMRKLAKAIDVKVWHTSYPVS